MVRLPKSIIGLVIVSYLSSADAQAPRTFGAWQVGVMSGDEGVYAATMNDSGGVFGEYCYKSTGQCLWLLTNDIKCNEGTQVPILANTDGGAFSSTVKCISPNNGISRYIIDYKIIEPGIEGSLWIGIAYPMKNGQFQVSRFNLSGASQAKTYMEEFPSISEMVPRLVPRIRATGGFRL